MILTGNSVSYANGLGNVTLATTHFTDSTISNPQDSFNVTDLAVSLLSVIIGIVVGIILFVWYRKYTKSRSEGDVENNIGKYNV